MTKQRQTILDVIRSDTCHHTAEEIFILAKQRLPGISRATVYNNLKALEKDKLIRRITGDDSFDRYDKSYIPHGHILCQKCGMVQDFDIKGLDNMIVDNIGQDYDSYELKVRIVCDRCAKNV